MGCATRSPEDLVPPRRRARVRRHLHRVAATLDGPSVSPRATSTFTWVRTPPRRVCGRAALVCAATRSATRSTRHVKKSPPSGTRLRLPLYPPFFRRLGHKTYPRTRLNATLVLSTPTRGSPDRQAATHERVRRLTSICFSSVPRDPAYARRPLQDAGDDLVSTPGGSGPGAALLVSPASALCPRVARCGAAGTTASSRVRLARGAAFPRARAEDARRWWTPVPGGKVRIARTASTRVAVVAAIRYEVRRRPGAHGPTSTSGGGCMRATSPPGWARRPPAA